MKSDKYRVIVWNNIGKIKDMKDKVTTLELSTVIEAYRKVLRCIVSIPNNISELRIDNQFRVVDRLIERFSILYKDQIDTERLTDFLRVSRDLRYSQVIRNRKGI